MRKSLECLPGAGWICTPASLEAAMTLSPYPQLPDTPALSDSVELIWACPSTECACSWYAPAVNRR
ncbi:hypothetical protein EMIT0P265_10830 [Pseudomonas zeae]